MEVAPWESLTPALLELILERLPIPDYLRFASVCLSWHHVQRAHRRDHAVSVPYKRQLPWLMLPGDGKSKVQNTVFYSPSEQRCYRLREGVNIDIWKPPQTIPSIDSIVKSPAGIPYIYSRLEVTHGILSSVSNPDSTFVTWDHRQPDSISIGRVQEPWTTHTHPIEGRFSGHPVFCKGKFYALLSHMGKVPEGRKLMVVDTLSVQTVSCIDMEMGLPPPMSIVTLKYLVECDGQILLARLSAEGENIIGFEVFKADLYQKVWVRLESLGNRVLFLANWHSFSLSASETGGPGNHIYFSWLMKDKLLTGYNYGNHHLIGVNFSNLPRSVEHDLLHQYTLGLWQWVVPLL